MKHVHCLSREKQQPVPAASPLVKQHQAALAADIVGIISEIAAVTLDIAGQVKDAVPGDAV